MLAFCKSAMTDPILAGLPNNETKLLDTTLVLPSEFSQVL